MLVQGVNRNIGYLEFIRELLDDKEKVRFYIEYGRYQDNANKCEGLHKALLLDKAIKMSCYSVESHLLKIYKPQFVDI